MYPLYIAFLALAGTVPHSDGTMSVALNPSAPPPAAVGTLVTWTASVGGASAGTLWYRFRARRTGDAFHVVRDYGPPNTLDWTASDREGNYEVQVSVENRETGESATATAAYQVTSRVADGSPVINPTANPLVFLYSAEPCVAESRMRVQLQSPEGFVQYTPYKRCRPGSSMNFYLAGMRPNTQYTVKHTIDTGFEFQDGPELTLTTPAVDLSIAPYQVLQQPPSGTNAILLQSPIFQQPVATDLYGNLVWYYPGQLTFLTRAARGGRFFGLIEDQAADPSHQILREFDLAGTTLRETNAARINEQLAAMGKRSINDFHHDAASLPDGKILVLAATEQVLTDTQGPGPVDVIGDMILVLDRDLQVVWAWDAFDHLDTHRLATLGEKCGATALGCPPLYLAQVANDWVHGNALGPTADGNILYSMRHQDWVVKIDYSGGEGTGNILWRLGKDGDFQVNSSDPYPWFSHQHDADFAPGDPTLFTAFDDGNLRRAANPNANSRGQAWRLDEQKMTATPVLNTDLGGYSFALGTAQALPDGNYQFSLGWLPTNHSQSVETDASGNRIYTLDIATPEYRVLRMRDLYTP